MIESEQPPELTEVGDSPETMMDGIDGEVTQSVVEIQHADQPQRMGENTEAEASFERDIAASEVASTKSVDEIMDDLSD